MNTKLDGLSISRRGFLAFAGAASGVALLVPRQILAQDDGLVQMARRSASSGTITVQKLRGNISVLMGAGGNIAVLPGRDGKLLIDAGFAGSRPKLTDALASISSDPIKQLINTHWHFATPTAMSGCTLFAHTNTKKRLSTTTRVEGWNFTFPPAPAGAIPADVFDDERTLKLNGTSIALKYYGHTDGDISVYFTDADVFHQGKSLDEIVATKPTAATDANWGNGFRKPQDFIGDVFQGV